MAETWVSWGAGTPFHHALATPKSLLFSVPRAFKPPGYTLAVLWDTPCALWSLWVLPFWNLVWRGVYFFWGAFGGLFTFFKGVGYLNWFWRYTFLSTWGNSKIYLQAVVSFWKWVWDFCVPEEVTRQYQNIYLNSTGRASFPILVIWSHYQPNTLNLININKIKKLAYVSLCSSYRAQHPWICQNLDELEPSSTFFPAYLTPPRHRHFPVTAMAGEYQPKVWPNVNWFLRINY